VAGSQQGFWDILETMVMGVCYCSNIAMLETMLGTRAVRDNVDVCMECLRLDGGTSLRAGTNTCMSAY
jgi:hypothetical protein